MDARTILFYLIAALTIASAVRVVTARNPVHSALFLILTFVSAAAMWLMLGAEFLAIVLVLVYIGAVMVLFLFVVMMVDIGHEGSRGAFWKALPVALFVAGAIVVELSLVLWTRFGMVDVAPVIRTDIGNTTVLGQLMFTQYLYPLQIAGAILLVGMVAAIALTLRRRKDTKWQNVGRQVRVRVSDRLRMANMPSGRAASTSAARDGQGTRGADGTDGTDGTSVTRGGGAA